MYITGLGIDPATIAAGTGLIKALTSGGSSSGSSRVDPKKEQRSPAFQQSFQPQIAPVFTQVQDSPGSTQISTPYQYSASAQTVPGKTGYPGTPTRAVGVPFTPASPTTAADIVEKLKKGDYNNLITIGILVAGGLMAVNMLTGKKKSRDKSKSLVLR